MLKVTKFGGSSVAGSEQFKKVKAIIEADEARKIVIVSAAGKRDSSDHKFTDLLYLCDAHLTYGVSCAEILAEIRERLTGIASDLGLHYDVGADFDAFAARLKKGFPVDELVSRGEYFTAKLMAEFLGYAFVDASECIFFTYEGVLDKEKTYFAVSNAVEKYGRVLIPGFYGSLPTGKIRVMSRGGSDITGAVAAAAAHADVYENWTDVSGILMADPRIVKDPKPIPKITYNELHELAYAGASVLHEDSVAPCMEAGIPLNIRNTNAPNDPGTLIVGSVEEEEPEDERFITGITGRRNFDILTVTKRNMDTCNTLSRALAILSQYHVPVEHIILGLDSFAFVASSTALGDALYDIIADIKKNCRPDNIEIKDNIALVASVGRKMSSHPGISGKLFKALGDNNINIRTIAQGADELAIVVGVENSQFETAIRVLYDGFAG
ncbi:MAG: aspartate kinase [Oscillospiraceae bacterium]|nr:aspartate kinase [Oscillospiraceae bacterium]